jgi:hypothetical protein
LNANPFELETIRVVDEAIEDRICEGGLADKVVPGFDRELAGDQCRGAAMPILDDLHEIASLTAGEAVGRHSGRQTFAGYVGIANFWRWAETLGAFLSLIAPRRRAGTKQRILAAPAEILHMVLSISWSLILSELNPLGNRVLRQARFRCIWATKRLRPSAPVKASTR